MQDYTEHIEYGNLRCYWDPAGEWQRAHGDNKSTSGGKFYLECMKTSGEEPVFRVRVMQGRIVALGPLDLSNKTQPSDDEIVKVLKAMAA